MENHKNIKTLKLIRALNRMDELIEEMGGTIEERKQQKKDYNLLFNFITKKNQCSDYWHKASSQYIIYKATYKQHRVLAGYINNMNEELLKETFSYFEFATKGDSPLLRFEIDKNWLTVYFHNTLSSMGNEWKWTLLCSQNVEDYAVCSGISGSKVVERVHTNKLVNRITLMLAEKVRSLKQDCNILMNEYTLTKKEL